MYLVGCDDAVGAWVFDKCGGKWFPGMGVAFGVGDEQGMACGLTFTDWNGPNCHVSIAVERPVGVKWLIESGMKYIFGQVGCRRLTFVTESSNIKSVRLQERLGAIHEATLVGAGRNEDDILISRLTPDNHIWRRLNGKKQRKPAVLAGLCLDNPAPGTVEHQPVQHDAWRVEGELGNSLRFADLV